jgi:hypothetical protein
MSSSNTRTRTEPMDNLKSEPVPNVLRLKQKEQNKRTNERNTNKQLWPCSNV